MREYFKNHLCLFKIVCLLAVLFVGFTARGEELVRRIRFQNPAAVTSNISGEDLFPFLTVDQDIVESVETSGVTHMTTRTTSTTAYKWGSVAMSNGFIKFNLIDEAEGFISKIVLWVHDFSSGTDININGVSEYNYPAKTRTLIFDINQTAASVTIACADGYIDFELVELYYDSPLQPVVYNEAGEVVSAGSADVIVGQLLNVVSGGADRITVKHNGVEKYNFEGEHADFRPMEPGEYTFSGSNAFGESSSYTILVTVNRPVAGQHLTPVTDESGLLPGYLYVYQIFTENGIKALSTTMHSTYTSFPVAIDVQGDGSTYQDGMETMLLNTYQYGWSWKLMNMGKYLNLDPIFDDNPGAFEVVFNQDKTAEITYYHILTHKFCYSPEVKCFSLSSNYQGCLFGRLYRVDAIAELPIESTEDNEDNQTVTVNGEKCVTRTLTVTFPAPAGRPASTYVLRYGEIDLAQFELIGSDYVATATLPYIKGADLMVIGSGSDSTGSFSLGNPWRDLENTVVEQPVEIPAVITINVASGKASFRQALNFECDTPCELEISEESHPSGELIKENDGRYYYVIDDYIKDLGTDGQGIPHFSDIDMADVRYDVTPVFKVASNSAQAPARVMARDGEAYNVYTLRGTTLTHNYTATDMSVSGIEDIRVDATTAAPATYYTIDGINLGTTLPAVPGLYIRHQGNNTSKILIK